MPVRELDAPTDAVRHLQADPVLAAVIDRHGPLGLEPAADPFRRLVQSVTRQQVSTAAARAIEERLFDAVEVTPAALATADETALREAGLSRQKAAYVVNIAQAFLDNDYSRETFVDMDDDAVVAALTRITGVGPWTAKLFLQFGLGREDVFPVEDLGIRRGMERLCGLEDRAAMVERAEAWRPYRSTASLYLWRVAD